MTKRLPSCRLTAWSLPLWDRYRTRCASLTPASFWYRLLIPRIAATWVFVLFTEFGRASGRIGWTSHLPLIACVFLVPAVVDALRRSEWFSNSPVVRGRVRVGEREVGVCYPEWAADQFNSLRRESPATPGSVRIAAVPAEFVLMPCTLAATAAFLSLWQLAGEFPRALAWSAIAIQTVLVTVAIVASLAFGTFSRQLDHLLGSSSDDERPISIDLAARFVVWNGVVIDLDWVSRPDEVIRRVIHQS